MYTEVKDEFIDYKYNEYIKMFKDRLAACKDNMHKCEEQLQVETEQITRIHLKEFYNNEEANSKFITQVLDFYSKHEPIDEYVQHLDWLWNNGNLRDDYEYRCFKSEVYRNSDEYKLAVKDAKRASILGFILIMLLPYFFVYLWVQDNGGGFTLHPLIILGNAIAAFFGYAFISPVVFPVSFVIASFAAMYVAEIPYNASYDMYNIPRGSPSTFSALKKAGIIAYAAYAHKSLSSNKDGWIEKK